MSLSSSSAGVEIISAVLLPFGPIDACVPPINSFIALAVTLPLPVDADPNALLRAAEVLALFDAGEKSLGGKGMNLEGDHGKVSDAGITVVMKPREPKGAGFRLQTLLEPLGGTGSITTWDVASHSITHGSLPKLAAEFARTRALEPEHQQSLVSLRDCFGAEVIHCEEKALRP